MSILDKPKKFIKIKNINKIAIVLIILGIGLGLLITAQWRTKTLRVSNSVTPYVSLAGTRDKLTLEQNNLKKQITELQGAIKDDQNKLKKQSQSKKQVEKVEKYKDLIGVTEKQGSGVTIKLDDSHTGIANTDSITHAADLRDIINLLWGAGAEAIAINGERIVQNTSIDCIVNTILINSSKTTAPFTISALGDDKRMMEELQKDDNLQDLRKRVKSDGVIFEINQAGNLVIPAFDGSFPIKYAKSMN